MNNKAIFKLFENYFLTSPKFLMSIPDGNWKALQIILKACNTSEIRKFCFQIWEMVKKIETDIDRQLLFWKLIKNSILAKFIGKIMIIIKTKNSLSTSVFIFSTIS